MRESSKKSLVSRIRERLTFTPGAGVASPNAPAWTETADIAPWEVMQLYHRDTTCKASVDLLAASVVKRFYTTCASDSEYPDASKAKQVVDDFCANEAVDLDTLLHDMAVRLIACGNDFWLKLTPSKLTEFVRLPDDAIEKIILSTVSGTKIPYHATSYQMRAIYRSQNDTQSGQLKPEAVLHWSINPEVKSGFGVGLLQVLLHTLKIEGTERRPAYAAMKAKIEAIMPGIFEKYAGPDVLANVPGASDETIKKFEAAIKDRKKEGNWLFYTGKNKDGNSNASVMPIQIDPRARFDSYIDHMVNQLYLGCETPLPRLFSTPGFTEASANAALDLQDMLVDPVSRMIKRRVEREIFSVVVKQADFDSVKAAVRLNWGTPETPQIVMADLVTAATASVPLIRPEEFRKNAVKFGWELWDPQPQPQSQVSSEENVGR